ncbi:MAG: ferredoxin family protein [Candidatus Omnitrophota bacterium]|nr:ferredoxin family protein [Candidatus Omnitrophota bacterium]
MEQPKDFSKQKCAARITINEKWCKKCGICIAFCPQGVFTSDDFGTPIVKHPEKCVKCMLCVVRCPDLAIDVRD